MSAKERVSEDPKVQNIIDEIEEDIQRERLNKIWEKYGNHFIAAAVAIVIGTGAFVTWKSWIQTRNAENTAAFIAALDTAQADDTQKAIDALAALAKNTPEIQAALTNIQLAALKVRQGDQEAAVAIYDRMAASPLPQAYRNLALFLSIQAQADMGDADSLLARIAPLTDTESPWRSLARELAATIHLRKGDKVAARALLEANIDDADASALLRGRDEALIKNME
ncbi:MAG TPA: hypothetical protein DCW68_05015 [Rhodospirillaceae bacterium]|nr:MAG: hypothetical protein A2018_02630 [Alphaproteobacteria bacterium GWF2_58_20]HAU29456.1 hypothetical protein [Rhodospirillaceae bacterium]